MSELCKECGGDPVIADIARRMGHRPDIAYARVRKVEAQLEQQKQTIIDEAKKLKVPMPVYDKVHYNQAIDDVIAKIESM